MCTRHCAFSTTSDTVTDKSTHHVSTVLGRFQMIMLRGLRSGCMTSMTPYVIVSAMSDLHRSVHVCRQQSVQLMLSSPTDQHLCMPYKPNSRDASGANMTLRRDISSNMSESWADFTSFNER
jgi:hypothetical protein